MTSVSFFSLLSLCQTASSIRAANSPDVNSVLRKQDVRAPRKIKTRDRSAVTRDERHDALLFQLASSSAENTRREGG